MTGPVDFNPHMCNCPGSTHHCIDRQERYYPEVRYTRTSNLDVIPPDLIMEIGRFLPPEGQLALEQQSFRVHQSLIPLTYPIRAAEEAREWDNFRRSIVESIPHIRVVESIRHINEMIYFIAFYTIGISIGTLTAVASTASTARITSLINGDGFPNNMAALGTSYGICQGMFEGEDSIENYFQNLAILTQSFLDNTTRNCVILIISAIATSFFFDIPLHQQIAIFATHFIARTVGLLAGSAITFSLNKKIQYPQIRGVHASLMSGMLLSMAIYALRESYLAISRKFS